MLNVLSKLFKVFEIWLRNDLLRYISEKKSSEVRAFQNDIKLTGNLLYMPHDSVGI